MPVSLSKQDLCQQDGETWDPPKGGKGPVKEKVCEAVSTKGELRIRT